MVRNLKIVKGWPWRPGRTWRKSTPGPRDRRMTRRWRGGTGGEEQEEGGMVRVEVEEAFH
jgi:hypothetical protein